MSTTNASGSLPPGWWMDREYLAWVQSEILRLDGLGYSARQICGRLGVSSRTVSRVRERERLKATETEIKRVRRREDITREAAILAQSMDYGLSRGESCADIAEALGVHVETVRRYRRKMAA